MIGELLKLGSNIYNMLESATETVAVIISGDLAHTHLPSGPYGYSNASEPFDQVITLLFRFLNTTYDDFVQACGKWASTLDEKYIVDEAAQYADKALSCGYTGFVMLQGLLSVR